SVLATWVRILGGMCRWPHCDAAAWNADLDHTEPFNHRSPENGGATTANGLKPYCRHHHRLKHSGYWREVPAHDGSVVVISRAGSSYTSADSGLLDVLNVDPDRVADDAEAATTEAPPTTVANDAPAGADTEQHSTPSEAEAESQTPNPTHDAAPARGRKRRTREQNRTTRVRAERRRQHARGVVRYGQSQSRRERRMRLFDGSTAVTEDHDDGAPAPF
ncbi:MAG: hypothetical protein L0H59_08215, partial [Tomitella sp.]|nr:hypothetical protein [Tomitella sp.]